MQQSVQHGTALGSCWLTLPPCTWAFLSALRLRNLLSIFHSTSGRSPTILVAEQLFWVFSAQANFQQ